MNVKNLTPSQLKKMSQEEMYEEYKKITAHMLVTFYLDSMKVSEKFVTVAHVVEYADSWVKENVKPPHKGGNSGDCGS